MSLLAAVLDLSILVLVSLVPTVLYLSWIRQSERFRREGWGTLLRAFAYGAFFATFLAGILEAVLVGAGTRASQAIPAPEFTFLNGNSSLGVFFLVLVIAPFVEEALKGSGVYVYRDRIKAPSDGPVLGVSVGLGFGFFETLLYGLGAFAIGGLVAGIVLILIRSISSVLLHASSTGMFGYGFARSRFRMAGPGTGSYYLLAVLMHASFNALASLAAIVALFGVTGLSVTVAAELGLLGAIGFAFVAFEHVRSLVQLSRYPALGPGAERFRPRGRTPPPK